MRESLSGQSLDARNPGEAERCSFEAPNVSEQRATLHRSSESHYTAVQAEEVHYQESVRA